MVRGKVEIYRDVLLCCIEGTCKTGVMYHCGLAGLKAKQVMDFLTKKLYLETSIEEQIDKNGHRRKDMTIYKTTKNGRGLLRAIRRIDMMLGRTTEAFGKVADAT